ncbi:hypothetical protein ACFFX0_04485 [Citricoccus parietis]|uniref:Uncharacterized protein n=1 Tax=Citricoccus parietis TaxID=592307 RepID=A0ABV5FUZ4_9MICC
MAASPASFQPSKAATMTTGRRPETIPARWSRSPGCRAGVPSISAMMATLDPCEREVPDVCRT